jgi:hypothetical protein
MNKVSAICVAGAVCAVLCSPLSAADLGQARVRSHRNEVLVIDVPLVMEGKGESDQFTVVATGTVASAEGDHTLAFSHEVRHYQSGQHFVRLTSATAVDAAKLTVWMMVDSPYGKASRTFQLNLQASADGAERNRAGAINATARVQPAASVPHATLGSLAAMNARLDEDTQRIAALVAQQRQDLAAQMTQLERQRAQLAAMDRQSHEAAAITSATKAQLDERNRLLSGLGAELNDLLGTPGGEAAVTPFPPHEQSPGKVLPSPASTTRDNESGLLPVTPAKASTAGAAPAAGTPDADQSQPPKKTTHAGAAPAINTKSAAATTARSRSNTPLWVGIAILGAALTGNVLLSWRKGWLGKHHKSDPALTGISGAPRTPKLYGLHVTPASTSVPDVIGISLTGSAPLWVDATGLTDDLVEQMRRHS